MLIDVCAVLFFQAWRHEHVSMEDVDEPEKRGLGVTVSQTHKQASLLLQNQSLQSLDNSANTSERIKKTFE